jgi:hypothetical protein
MIICGCVQSMSFSTEGFYRFYLIYLPLLYISYTIDWKTSTEKILLVAVVGEHRLPSNSGTLAITSNRTTNIVIKCVFNVVQQLKACLLILHHAIVQKFFVKIVLEGEVHL